MANRTVKDAVTIRGTNPQLLIEKIIRTRILDSVYWKEECFALTAELLVDKALELKFVGGVYGGNVKVAPFLCLVLKMLQIQPEKDIVVEFITQTESKYVRALGAMYMRLTGSAVDCYKYLEPLYCDYSKIKRQKRDGSFEIIHMDEFVDELLLEERALDVILPRIPTRANLEGSNQLEPKESVDFDCEASDDEGTVGNDKEKADPKNRSPSVNRDRSLTSNRRSRERSSSRRRASERGRKRVESDRKNDRDEYGRRSRSRDRCRDRSRDRQRNRSRDRRRDASGDRDDSKKRRDKDGRHKRERDRSRSRNERHKKTRK